MEMRLKRCRIFRQTAGCGRRSTGQRMEVFLLLVGHCRQGGHIPLGLGQVLDFGRGPPVRCGEVVKPRIFA